VLGFMVATLDSENPHLNPEKKKRVFVFVNRTLKFHGCPFFFA